MNSRRHFKWLIVAGAILVVLLLVIGNIFLLRYVRRPVGPPREETRDLAGNTETNAESGIALPTSRRELIDLGKAYGRDGNWRMAFACFRKVVATGTPTEWEWSWATGSALAAGETNACVQLCRQMLEQFGRQDDPDVAERCAKQCLSLPDPPPDLLERGAARAEFALAADSKNRWFQLAKGMAEYRRGHWSESLEALRQPERTGLNEITVQAWAFGAMARHQLGDSAGARKALAEVNRRLQFMIRTGELGHPRNNTWDNCARVTAVRAEAERLILGRQISPPLDPAAVAQNRQTWAEVLQTINFADQMAKLEQWPAATGAYAAVLQHPAFNWENFELKEDILAQKMAVAFLLAGDDARHRQLSTNLLERNPDSLTSTMQERYASAILGRTDHLTPELIARAVALARLASEGEDKSPYRMLIRGVAEYRDGRYAEVMPLLSRANFPGDPIARGRAYAFVALAERRLGRTNESAQAWLQAENTRRSARTAGWWNIGAYELVAREYRSLTNAPANFTKPQ
jgi:hypothetical protein